MVRPRYLRNAPIKEAIIDFRVKAVPGFDVTTFLTLTDRISADFPVREERKVFEGTIEFESGKPPSQSVKPEQLNGYFFKSADGLNIAQFRTDGFTFNRLKPYTSWEAVFPKAWELWNLYTTTGAGEFITRVAVRYINSIGLPGPVENLADYLSSPPKPPAGVVGEIASFLTRIVINTKGDESLTANVTQALDKKSSRSGTVILLDIDAYKQGEFEIRDDKITQIFEALRALKNEIFFNSITENTARLCE